MKIEIKNRCTASAEPVYRGEGTKKIPGLPKENCCNHPLYGQRRTRELILYCVPNTQDYGAGAPDQKISEEQWQTNTCL